MNFHKLKKASRPVIICGGGVGGLTLANCLKISKIPFVLLEKAKEFQEVGGGIGLWGTALKALRAIELEDKLEQKGRKMVSAGYRISNQIDRGEWLVRPSSVQKRHTSCLTLKRADLLEELLNGINKEESLSLNDSSIRVNSKLLRFTDNQEGDHVKVFLENGETLEGSLLVGADGINSEIRRELFPGVVPLNCSYHYWQGVTKLDSIMVEKGYSVNDLDLPAFEAWHPGMRFGVVALKYPYIFWFLASDENLPSGMTTKAGLLEICMPFGQKIHHMIESTEENMITKHLLRDIEKMPKWTKGRVALLGDAVHAMAPNLAQGAVLAIEDALELGHQIYMSNENDSCPPSISIDQSFINYEKIRQKRAYVVQTLVPWVHAVGSADRFAHIRNVIFKYSPAFIRTPIFDNTHRFSLGWNYTAPNLGQGLYYRLLGGRFMSINPIFNQFHSEDRNRFVKGTVSVKRGNGIGGFIARVLGLPQEVQDGLVDLTVITDKSGKEIWNRNFRDKNNNILSTFNTVQYLFEEDLKEDFHFFYFIFEAKVKEEEKDRFYFILKESGLRFGQFRLKFPKFISPVVQAVTIATEKGWKFETKIKSNWLFHTFVGDILSYKGNVEI